MAERWRKDRSRDPMTQMISEFHARADHHLRHHQMGAARTYGEMAELLDLALHLCGSKDFSYEDAATISGWSEQRLRAELTQDARAKGRIPVAALPIKEGTGPMHSVRARALLQPKDRKG